MPAALPHQELISQASSGSQEFRVIEVQYGNGYTQVAPDGINNEVDTWQVSWENITQSEYTDLVAALKAAKGADYFTWAPPNESTKKFRIASYSKSVSSGNIYTVSASLKQAYVVSS